MGFRIAEIETRIVDHPLIESRIVVSQVGRHDTSRFLTVRVRNEDGACGYGEAATTAMWSGETAETAQIIIEQLFAPRLLNCTFDHPREALAVMDELSNGNSFTKSAIDCALWDLWARLQKVSAARLFGDRTPLSLLPTRASVGCYDVKETVQIATEFWTAGIRNLKFKIGVPPFDDAARLCAVREKLGDEPVFTVDANGAYQTTGAAVAAIEALLPYRVTVVEQPTPRDRIRLLGEVRRRVEVPIMADECVFTPGDLREVLDGDACDLVSLYPGKNGGLTHSIDMANLAMQAGKACALGSNIESDLGQAAMVALAASLSAFPAEGMICDLAASLYYQESPLNRPLRFENGRVEVPDAIGLGVVPMVDFG